MGHVAAVETELLREQMSLVEFLSRSETPDGMPRTPGLLIVSTLGVAWVVEVIDRHTQLGFAAMGLTLDGAVESANAMLASGSPPWSPLKGKGRVLA